jgi:hypothetical protein
MKSRMTLRYCGTPDARRFYIERADGFVWSGLHWSADIADAALWADLQHANHEFNCLCLIPHQGKPVKQYECRLVLRVHGEQPFTLDELRAWLHRALRITVDIEATGEGPVDDTFVLPVVMLEALRPVSHL